MRNTSKAVYPRTVTFSSPSGRVRAIAQMRTHRLRIHYQHTRYVRAFSATFRAH